MNILSEVKTLLATLGIPIETGTFKSEAPNKYIVLVPLSDSFPVSADDKPVTDVQELRITLFSKENYLQTKNRIVSIMIANYFFITDRKYNGYDTDTGYYQYTIDVAKQYEIEEEEN